MALEPNNKGHARPATNAPSDKPAVPLFPPQERFHSRDQDKENDEKPKHEGHPITRMPPKEERLLQSSWPKEYIRLRYPVVSRKSFGALQLLKPGGLSVVYHATHLATKTDMVLKVLMEKDDWNCEMRGYANSKTNPAVVQLIAVMALSATEANQLCHGIKGYIPRESHEDVGVMVFERWDSSLRDAIDAGRVREWGLLTSVGLMKDVARAVAFMHKNDVMHRDIKPDNILFRTIDNKISAGLCDLGLATKVTEKGDREAYTQGVGTNKYMAPECANGTEYTVAADVYSLAVTMWEVCMAACRLRAQMPEHLSRLMKRGSSTREEDRLDSKKFYIMLKRIYQFLEKKEGKPGGYIDVYQSDTQSDYGGGDRRDKEPVFPEDLLLEISAPSSKRKEEENSEGSEGKKKRSRSRAKEEQETTTKKRSKREETKEKAKKKTQKKSTSNKSSSKKRVTKQEKEEESEEEEKPPKLVLRRSRRVMEREK